MKLLTLKLLMIVSVGLLLAACTKPAEETKNKKIDNVSIAVSMTPLSTPFFVAKENGYFSEMGLNVLLVNTIGGHRCLVSVLDGKTDMGTSSDYPIMMKSFTRDDFVVLTTFVSSENDVKLITDTSQGILTPKDIKGKRIGTVTGASSHFFLDRFLLFNEMTLNDVEVMHVNPENMVDAILNAEVDAIAAWEPYGYQVKNKLGKKTKIFNSSNYYRETFNLVSKSAFANQNPEVVVKVIRALDKAIQYIENHPQKSQNIVVSYLNVDSGFIEWVWKDFDFALTLDQSFILTLEKESRWAVTNNIVKHNKFPNYLGYINFDAMSSVKPDAITIIY